MEIAAILRARGFEALLVGGCVRDELLGIPPKDYDIATNATPAEVLRLFPRAEAVGAHFGVILVPGADGAVEVATFRSDSAYRDGRHPEAVRFESSPRQDALRRDFTINALFRDPFTGEVLDFTGGQADLRAGIVRAIGDPMERFGEDHLRMLRAVRFAARFHFVLDPATYAAMAQLRGRIHGISAERIRDELTRILTEGGADRGLELLDGCGLLEELLPEVKAFQGVEQPPEYHPEGDVWTHVLLMLRQMGKAPATLAWGVLLHDVGKPPTFRVAERIRFDGHVEVGEQMARAILHRLKFSNEASERICALVAQHMRFKDVPRMRQSTLKRFLRLPDIDEHLELHRLDCLSSNRNLDSHRHVSGLLAAMPPETLRPPRLISGDDLIAAGMKPGPEFARLLREVEDAQLDGRVETREQALRLIGIDETPPHDALPPHQEAGEE